MILGNYQYSLTLKKRVFLKESFCVEKTDNQLNFPALTDSPLLSVVVVVKNGIEFIHETLTSISNQSFKNYELIVIDGASTDGTKEFLERTNNIILKSESDQGIHEGFSKAMKIARGKYITHCCVSDGYLDIDWFDKALKKLESNPGVSLVWGFPRLLNGQTLEKIAFPIFQVFPPLNGIWFYLYLLKEKTNFPEGNYIVATEVMRKCFPVYKKNSHNDDYLSVDPWLEFVFNFNKIGYLSSAIKSVANYGRSHPNSITNSNRLDNTHDLKLNRFKSQLDLEASNLYLSEYSKIFFDKHNRKIIEISHCRLKIMNFLIDLYLLPWILLRYSKKLIRRIQDDEIILGQKK